MSLGNAVRRQRASSGDGDSGLGLDALANLGLSPEAIQRLNTAAAYAEANNIDITEAIRILGTLDPSFLPPDPDAGRSGGTGRTQFASEAALDAAQTALYNAQAGNVARAQQESEANSAFERAQARIQLLQASEQLVDARRENATSALINALPYAVAPGTQYAPGMEPGGPAQALSQLVGANFTPSRLPTANVDFGALAATPPGAQTPGSIDAALLPLLNS